MTAVISWLGRPQPDDPTVPTLVLLHGHGSHEQDLIQLVPAMQMFLPDVHAKVLAVRGSFPALGRPRGYSWFPGSVREQPPAESVALAVDAVAGVVRQHTGRAVVLGFSQGMCMAVTLLRRHPELVRAVVGLSGFVYDDWQPGDAELSVRVRAGAGVPAFFGYDPADPIVPIRATDHARRYLHEHTELEEHRYPGIGHGVGLPEITDVARFLTRFLHAGS
ncbi:alpha/beta hydrolase [Nakamurella leprariae]|uniref:Dienelactone hydrolase family protein n=1 Tax=Nakamurella leprariae TaxID=2803911 RepID=A0A939C121_9ACTN|nr:dienelactone hydrolase family protein [Nakamurella leprariae]MBM9466659.1 dienelactone hydrolase family protein [Nakamurella leprariae]